MYCIAFYINILLRKLAKGALFVIIGTYYIKDTSIIVGLFYEYNHRDNVCAYLKTQSHKITEEICEMR